MHEHPTFRGLLVQGDDELAAALGSDVVSRGLVHEWPLTRTERVELADGRRYAVKAQLLPTVEPSFYAAATSSLLLPFVDLGRSGETVFMATEWLDAPTLHSAELTDPQFVEDARRLVREIGSIDGAPPVFLDLSTAETFGEAVKTTAGKLETLVAAGRFANLPADVPSRLLGWAASGAVISAATSHPRITHGDLSPEEVFVTSGGFKVIDWQRPVLGPADLDLVSLLRYRRIDPLLHVEREVVQLSWFILLHWAALAHHDLLPELPPDVPEGWALSAVPHILG